MGQSLGCCLGRADTDELSRDVPKATPHTVRGARATTISMDSDLVVLTTAPPKSASFVDEYDVSAAVARSPPPAPVPAWPASHTRSESDETIDLARLHATQEAEPQHDPADNNNDAEHVPPLVSVKRPPALAMARHVYDSTGAWESQSSDDSASVDGTLVEDDDDDAVSNQEAAAEVPFAVAVTRFFPIEDKFEFDVTVVEAAARRHHVVIRDRARCVRYHELLEAVAARAHVPCPVLPFTKKLDRAQGRALMEAYVAAVLATPVLRDATCTLKYFHVIQPSKPIKPSPAAKGARRSSKPEAKPESKQRWKAPAAAPPRSPVGGRRGDSSVHF